MTAKLIQVAGVPMKMLEPVTTYESKYGDYLHQRVTLVTNAADRDVDMTKLLEQGYQQRCYCEHDCCGHWQSYATVKRIGKRTYIANVNQTLNV